MKRFKWFLFIALLSTVPSYLYSCQTSRCGCQDYLSESGVPDTLRLLNICIKDFNRLDYTKNSKLFDVDIKSIEYFWIVRISDLSDRRVETLLISDKHIGENALYCDYICHDGATYFIEDYSRPFTWDVFIQMLISGYYDDNSVYTIYENSLRGETYLVCKSNYNIFKRYKTADFDKMKRSPNKFRKLIQNNIKN